MNRRLNQVRNLGAMLAVMLLVAACKSEPDGGSVAGGDAGPAPAPTDLAPAPSPLNMAADGSCLTGFHDLDQAAENGCEYACVPSGWDMPDPARIDADCDGIDGDSRRAVFVSTTGADDAVAGTRERPARTLGQALRLAQAQQKSQVLVDEGTYFETLYVRTGISIHGGYRSSAAWSRPVGASTIIRSGFGPAIRVFGAKDATVSGFEIEARVVGIEIADSTIGLRDLEIRVERGANGAAGSCQSINGQPGVPSIGVYAANSQVMLERNLIVTGGGGNGGDGQTVKVGCTAMPGSGGRGGDSIGARGSSSRIILGSGNQFDLGPAGFGGRPSGASGVRTDYMSL